MGREIEKLLVRIGGDAAGLVTALEGGEKKTESFSQRVRSNLTSTVSFVTGSMAAIGAAGAAIFVSTANEVDRLAKQSAKIGIPTAKLAGLELAAEKSGVAVNTIGTGLQRMTRRVAEAAGGTGVAVKALDSLNLSAKDLSRLSPDQQFGKIADAFEGVGSQSEKVRLAFALFDSDGVGLINTMNGGAEALAAVQLEAERLGIALSEVDTSRIEAANDALILVKRSSQGVARQAVAAFAPVVEVLAMAFVDSTGDVRSWRATIETAVDYSVKGIGFVVRAWYRLDAAADFVIGMILKGFSAAIKGTRGLLMAVEYAGKKFGVEFGAGGAIKYLRELETESNNLGEAFIADAKKETAAIDTVADALEASINEARKRKRVPTVPTVPTGPIGGDDAAKKAAAAAAAERKRLEAELAQLERSLLDKRGIIEQDYQARAEKLAAYREAELVTDERYGELLAQAAQRRQADLTALDLSESEKRKRIAEAEAKAKIDAEKKARDNRLSIASSVAQGLDSIGNLIVAAAGKNNKAALVAQKAFAVAAIAINTYIAASRAMAELGPIAGPIAAAAITAGGIAATAAVIATDVGSTTRGGGAGATTGAGGGAGALGDDSVCASVRAVSKCGGAAASDGRLGSGDVFNVVQIGDDNVDRLIDQIRRRVDSSGALLFSGDSQQARQI